MASELERVCESVAKWRAKNPDGWVDTPVTLQQRIVKLLERHTWTDVCSGVGVSHNRLATWRNAHREALGLQRRASTPVAGAGMEAGVTASSEICEFVEIPLHRPERAIDVDVRLPCGTVVSVRGASDPGSVGAVVGRILAETRSVRCSK